MFSLNRVHVIGYQTQQIEIRKTPGGTSVVDLNLVVPYTFQSAQGESLQGRAFHTVTLWGSMAEFAGQYVRPGSQIFIGGRLQTDTWEDQTTKEKRSKTKIVALDMILLDPKDGQRAVPEGAKLTLNAVNRADLVGNVTRDPEIRTTTGGKQVLTLGVATNDRWKDRATNEVKERTEFHNVVIWGDLADEVNKVARKGSRVFVSGRVQTRAWETPQGQKRTTTEIVADQCALLGVKSTLADETVAASAQRRSLPRSEAALPSEVPAFAEASPFAKATGDMTAGGPSGAPAASDIPEIQYASEVKVEDLPF